MIDSNIITALSALSRYDVKLKRKGLNTPDFLPKAPRHRSKLLHISNTLRIYKSTGSLRHHRHPSPGNHFRRFELTLSAGGGRTRNPRGNYPRPLSTGRTLPLSFSSDLRRSSLWIYVERRGYPRPSLDDHQNQDPGKCSIVSPIIYEKERNKTRINNTQRNL